MEAGARPAVPSGNRVATRREGARARRPDRPAPGAQGRRRAWDKGGAIRIGGVLRSIRAQAISTT